MPTAPAHTVSCMAAGWAGVDNVRGNSGTGFFCMPRTMLGTAPTRPCVSAERKVPGAAEFLRSFIAAAL
eukprot:CAMPEP_0174315740 /NCGR_PEP_ID=MMETSP0810-20121108/6474_1 /TAXON_ID=73025 ORGANISM="Eutreptiella gymnastica-like, Strain CCMP1594" /NCGR_SAMPLE_ID=MMETSP0810 /ASSEMBLY_ACC=CAM_ASM_000659 /LENGTH=68 /DNA_ID=CAMNT_0015425199 /DNA_START=3557 /DNA_END=3763 /DNA_ORIENTATION=-